MTTFSADSFPAITELVPHQTPVLALEKLTSWELGHAHGELTIRDSNPFVQNGKLDTVMSLEYMAQCVAACLGMEAFKEGGNVRVGMIIACRKMEILQPELVLGETYAVKADCVRGNDSISHYDGEIRSSQGELVATCTMTLVHGEKPPE
ncbi:MAG: putative hotdog family 3-hydroxylacyl-ACP dehydratase [Planctomycetota bacterium]